MANKDAFQRYLDAGIAFTNMTRARAEELVQELVQSGEFQSGDARAKVDELLERTRKGREAFVSQVRHEVARQLDSMGITNVEDLAKQVARSCHGLRKRAGRRRRPGRPRERPRRPRRRRHRRRRPRPRRRRRRRRRQEGGGQEVTGQEAAASIRGDEEVCRPRRPRRRRRRRKLRSIRRHRVGGLTRPARRRLDRALVERGLVDSRPQAVELIEQGAVLVSGSVADKPARLVAAAEPIELAGRSPTVRQPGRGEAGRRTGAVRHRPDRSRGPWTRAPPPAGSPTACCRPAPPRWSPSTWAGASSTSGCGRTTG